MKYLALSVLLMTSAVVGPLFCQKTSADSSFDPHKKYAVKDLQFDLAILRTALQKTHPGLFWYQSETEFNKTFLNTHLAVKEPLTETAFLKLLTPFVAAVKCGHTDIGMSEAFNKYSYSHNKYFPFSVKIIESRVFISKNISNDSSLLLGTEIISINGITTDSILGQMRPYGWSDGFQHSDTRIQYNFHNLLRQLFDAPVSFDLGIVDRKGTSSLVHVEGLDVKTLDERFYKRAALTRYHSFADKKHEPFRFQLIDTLSTAIIRIDGFEGKGYHKFLAETFDTIKSKRTKNLIIDLRGNGGGEDDYGRLLYSFIALKQYRYYKHLEVILDDPNDTILKYGKMPFKGLRLKFFHAFRLKKTGESKYDLKTGTHPNLSKKPFKPQKNNFRGKVFILIDEESFSTTTEFCAITHYNKRARFVGRESGGSYCGNTSGTNFELVLPNTGIQVAIPLIAYYSAVEGLCGHGIKPDYPLTERIEDLVLGVDSDLLFTLNLIKNEN